MSRKKNLKFQVTETLKEKLAIGQSKHNDKAKYEVINNKKQLIKEDTTNEKIYSWETYHSYLKHCLYFAEWCKNEHNCKDIKECRAYVDEWLISRSGTCSAYTVKLEASALAKLYGCTTEDFIKTKSRIRKDITRSRGEKVRDKHFSEKNNKDLIEFCRSTGLRRRELTLLTGDKLRQDEQGNYYIIVDQGAKGGRYREVPVINHVDTVVRLMKKADKEKVFQKISTNADIHGYRSEYATSMYNLYARPLEQLKRSEKYYCRNDQKGKVFDKQAMLITSRALGHNRICIIGEHYLR